MKAHLVERATAIGSRGHVIIVALMAGTLLSATNAFAQSMRFYPIRSAPLGSPVGTVGDPVTPAFNSDLGCWEVHVESGVEVDLDLQGFGWGNAPGSPTLGAIQATVISAGYDNGFGAPLNPKGWPGMPGDGYYQARNTCQAGGDGSPCVSPFDPTCDNFNNGFCLPASNWIIPCGESFPEWWTVTLDYAWTAVAHVDCNVDDGEVKTLGGLILDVPPDAAGIYVIAMDPDPNNTFMVSGAGAPIPDVVQTSACITILGTNEPGRCCSEIGPKVVCEGGVTAQDCAMRPKPRSFAAGESCDGDCACPTCLVDADCDNGDMCTVDSCDECGQCLHTPIFSVEDECCNPASGHIIWIDDDDVCTTDTCDPSTGQVDHTDNPDCISFDVDAFPKNRYVSFETGALTVELAFQVRMTSSAHFPESVGDIGWVGAPDSKGTALVVPDPVFLPSWPAVVRAGDCEIVPAATYEIRATSDGVNFDPPVVVETTAPPTPKLWGDIVGEFNGIAWTPPNGVQNFVDVQAAIITFLDEQSTVPMIWADIGPETPNRIVNFNEVYWLLLAFLGEPYPFSGPADCP